MAACERRNANGEEQITKGKWCQALGFVRIGDSSARRMVVALLVAAGCGIGLLSAGLPEAFSPVGQWDFDAYYSALKVWNAGGNPWEMSEVVKAAQGAVHHFIYPHHTFAFFHLFAFEDICRAKNAYLEARLACVAALMLLWTYGFVRAGARGWFLAFAALGYNAAICRDLVVGNVSLFEQVLIWFGLFSLLRGWLGPFCLLIILASQFKVLPVCLLALVLVTGGRKKWAYLLGSMAACGLIAAGVYLSNPWAARTFAHLAWLVGTMEPGGTIHPCSLALFREAADALLRSSDILGGIQPRQAAGAAYVVFGLAVLGAYVWAVRRGMEVGKALFVGVLTYVLLAPRMKDYSYIIALVPTFELIREQMSKPGSIKWLVAGAVVLLAMPGLELLWQYRPLMLAGWAWAVGVSSAWTGAAKGRPARISDCGLRIAD
jgi:hypothetical protein